MLLRVFGRDIDTVALTCISLHEALCQVGIELSAIASKCWGSYPGDVIGEESR